MVEFAYNNNKNLSISYIFLELNYSYHSNIFFENEFDSDLTYHLVNKLVKKLKDLILICQQNLLYVQKL